MEEIVGVFVSEEDDVEDVVADAECVSLAEPVPVCDTEDDAVPVLETDTEAVGVEAAEAEVVADVVFVAECVSGPRVSVAVVVCDAETVREMLDEGVADHVLEAVGVKVAAAEAEPEIVDVLDVEIERVPDEDIVAERVVLIDIDDEGDTDEERLDLTETEDVIVSVTRVEGVPEKVALGEGEAEAETEEDRVDVLEVVAVREPECVAEFVLDAEGLCVEETDAVEDPDTLAEIDCLGVSVGRADVEEVRVADAVADEDLVVVLERD